MTHARLTPFLLIRCESCDDEHNCHPAKRVRWSVPMQGYDAGPIPVCQACWDGQYPDIPCHWQELDKITLSPEFGFTADERAVIDELAITQTTSPIAVLRQSLRLYQMHLKRLRDGETIHYSGDAQRARDFAGPTDKGTVSGRITRGIPNVEEQQTTRIYTDHRDDPDPDNIYIVGQLTLIDIKRIYGDD